MVQIRTVLCPIDFSALSERELALGIDVAQRFEARLVLHHNLDGSPPGAMGVGWMWSGEHRDEERCRDEDARKRLQELVEAAAEKVPSEGRMSCGSIGDALLQVTAQTEADLVVMGTHGRSTDEHRSATHSFLERSPCPVLTLRDHGADTSVFLAGGDAEERTFEALVPVDFAEYSLAAGRFAFALAGALPLRLHLLHVVAPPRHGLRLRRQPAVEPEERRAHRHELQEVLEGFVPEELRGRVDCSVTDGSIGGEILAVADRIRPDLVIMGTHRKSFFRKVLEGAPSHELLYGSGCPVLFVPEAATRRVGALATG